MSTKEAYKQKLNAELGLAQAKLIEFKAEAKNSAADVRVKYNEQLDDLQQMIDTTKEKLKELDNAGEDAWEHLKEGIESAWATLGTALKDTADKFKKK
ncbi:hypothetical protein [Sulfuricurvum sp.]|uniref:hypothetical protein n=1 Tax=Sulfuricurvum sp. TaxID=2025608 RepID=UPI002E312D55|nr:hypothetical protein [Sulfuricurvum sp.]HEX5329222.1 hypothetical protein [Sulfuricurvum sp.]